IDIPAHTRLDSRDLRLVLALATAGSTAGAASALHLTQPAVSRALLAAEDKLGVRLFERTPRGLDPTAAGATLIEGAVPLLTMLYELETRLGAQAAPTQRLRLVCECYTAYHWMPSALEGLRASLPGVDLVIAIESTRDPIAALEAGDIDVALVSEAPKPRSRRLVERPLFADEVVFVMAASHRLASRPALTQADLRGETLLTSRLPTRDMSWFNKPMHAMHEASLNYQVLPLTEAVIDFARANMGIGVLSEWIADPHLRRGDLLAKRLATGPLRRPWRLVWRKEVQANALRLLAVLERAAPRLKSLPALRQGRERASA
ncbi:LysR family transcriptional regulator, partial [Dyella silvatica]|uniref:LysR family transcriptional regulator n=1 Tax=Dyella silvatica TaxID=2992128 RepID=UPI0022509B99